MIVKRRQLDFFLGRQVLKKREKKKEELSRHFSRLPAAAGKIRTAFAGHSRVQTTRAPTALIARNMHRGDRKD